MGLIAFHTGDLGDIVASLPAIRALGGGDLVIGYQIKGQQRESMEGARFDAIKPLLECQPYLASVTWSDSKNGITHDFSTFRKNESAATLAGLNLAEWQAKHVGVEDVSLLPWLTVKPIPLFSGRIIFARTERYHNHLFPWRELVKRFGANACFVGLESEHHAFCRAFGHVAHFQTTNLLELAGIIAAANLFVGNQSCPYWIAAGLGVPIVQETCVNIQNSIVPRYNALYTRTDYETSRLMDEIDDIMEKVVA